ncbi:FHA domain-containing protein [Roseimaritima sediminicola]|uniref:FHA domain-containing protein n=1 Tax=Roseimaritima sediminicola TaxID=2662066 RepID=UPI0012985082|nr:FHA domain-containing protein [Roseimaritima sediminicola]
MSTPEWIFGSSPQCDVWIPESTVSAEHCSLRKTSQGYVLRDLGSTNGTFVAGSRIKGPTPIEPETQVMLGSLIALPWPAEDGASRIVRFGRSSENDFVIDSTNVSSFHGRIIVGHSGTWVVCDLASTNGIGLRQGHRFHVIRKAALITPNDTLLLGKTELRVQDITPLFRGAGPASPAAAAKAAGGGREPGRRKQGSDRRRSSPPLPGRAAMPAQRAGDDPVPPPVDASPAAVSSTSPILGLIGSLWWLGGIAALLALVLYGVFLAFA